MSLNRILQSAQKLGMPVVITDRDGAHAQVVLPFDDFMALAGASSHQGASDKHGVASGSMDDLDLEGVDDRADWDLSGFDSFEEEEPSQDPFDFTVEAPMDPVNEPVGEPSSSEEGLVNHMEEKFYLEPLDETDPLK